MGAAFGSYLRGLPEGNGDWSKWTPSGDLSITITNPSAIKQFEIGEVYLLTFERATNLSSYDTFDGDITELAAV